MKFRELMKEKGKKTLTVFLCLMLLVHFGMPQLSYAGDSAAVKDKKNELAGVNDKIDDTKDALAEGKAESKSLSAQIKEMEQKIYAKQVEINDKQQEINDTKELITIKIEELRLQEEEINGQNEELLKRLRAMYKNGETGMLAVLFGSSSMSELMTNMDMVQRIYESDADLLADMEEAYGVLVEKKEELQKLKEGLIAEEEALEADKEALDADRAALAAKKKEVDADNRELERQIDKLNDEAKALTAEIVKLQTAESYVGGSMLWPSQASKYVSSPFGNRLHPILKVIKFHTGIDIAAGSGTNILAANGGTVISACYNSGYGYMIMVDHGGGIVTLYAHCSKLLVSKGAKVKRGQVIALVGSTGMSTGPHLHFEVRINGEYKNPLEYVSR
ncbi:MAG: peptidoglycan DD-metalloendopeptidase family protein [Firmicutes bacterium]|nr:peptidoglycan DD-metalloendopeptidase family protein [Bacillota bacterium]